jgi:hypothetical protein
VIPEGRRLPPPGDLSVTGNGDLPLATQRRVENIASDRSPCAVACAHVRMFRFFGGVPRLIVPDNLKNGVHKASFYDPEINRSYGMMAARPSP